MYDEHTHVLQARQKLATAEKKLHVLLHNRDQEGCMSERACAKHMRDIERQCEKVRILRLNLKAEIAIRNIRRSKYVAGGLYDLLLSLHGALEDRPVLQEHIRNALDMVEAE